jgi:hypothetical protein
MRGDLPRGSKRVIRREPKTRGSRSVDGHLMGAAGTAQETPVMRIALITLFALGIFAFASAPAALADHCGQGCGCPCGTGYQAGTWQHAGPGHYVGRYPCAPGTYATSSAPTTPYSSPGMVTTYPSATTTTYPATYGTYRTSQPYGTYHRPYRRSFLGIRW